MQAARHAAKQLARRGAQQFKSTRGMASDANSEKAHLDGAMKEMSKWYAFDPEYELLLHLQCGAQLLLKGRSRILLKL